MFPVRILILYYLSCFIENNSSQDCYVIDCAIFILLNLIVECVHDCLDQIL